MSKIKNNDLVKLSPLQEFINENKLLSEREILEIIPIGRKGWLTGVKDGIYPQPIKWGKKLKFWREKDILQLMMEGPK